MRQTSELARQYQAESLARAQNGDVNSNYAIIMREFMARGIASADINPRENVLTFNAWKALGRHVRKGEHGVRLSFYPGQARVDARRQCQGPVAAQFRCITLGFLSLACFLAAIQH